MLRDQQGENPIGAILDACSGFAGKLLFVVATRITHPFSLSLARFLVAIGMGRRREEPVFASFRDGQEAHENFMRRLNRVYRGPPPRRRLNFHESNFFIARFSRDLTTLAS